jgi:hypothetical protein
MAVLATPYADNAPGPRVVVNVTAVTSGTVTATLRRRYGDTDEVVPGADRIQATTGFVRTDYYPPVGVPVTYQAQLFDVNGAAIGYTASATTTIDVPDSSAWLSSPTDPNLTVQVEMSDDAGSSLTRDIVSSVHQVGGRKILIAEDDYGLVNIPLSFWVDTVAEARVVDAILRDGLGLMVFRIAPPMEVPRVLYAIGSPSRQETNLPADVEDTLFEMTGDEGSAPATVIVAAVITYGRYTSNIATYGAFRSQYGTYRDALLAPPAEV